MALGNHNHNSNNQQPQAQLHVLKRADNYRKIRFFYDITADPRYVRYDSEAGGCGLKIVHIADDSLERLGGMDRDYQWIVNKIDDKHIDKIKTQQVIKQIQNKLDKNGEYILEVTGVEPVVNKGFADSVKLYETVNLFLCGLMDESIKSRSNHVGPVFDIILQFANIKKRVHNYKWQNFGSLCRFRKYLPIITKCDNVNSVLFARSLGINVENQLNCIFVGLLSSKGIHILSLVNNEENGAAVLYHQVTVNREEHIFKNKEDITSGKLWSEYDYHDITTGDEVILMLVNGDGFD